MKQVLRFLKHTADHGLVYSRPRPHVDIPKLEVYADAFYNACPDDAEFVGSGYNWNQFYLKL